MSQTQLKTISWPHSTFRAYNERNTSSLSPMEPEALDTNDLVALVQVATYWRLRLRNVAPETNQSLAENDPNFLQLGSADYSNGEKRFYECMEGIKALILNAPVPLAGLPLETLLPLAALLRIVLDNRHPSTNQFIGVEHPNFCSLNITPWNPLEPYWHNLKDYICNDLRPKLNYWLYAPWIKGKAEEKYQVTLDEEHIAAVLIQIWNYLDLSLNGQPSIRKKDRIFNPSYKQKSGNCTVEGWLKAHLFWRIEDIAKKLAEEQRLRAEEIINDEDEGQTIDPLDNVPARIPLQDWWEPIREAAEGPYAEELQKKRPRKRDLRHINAQLVILNLLPPESKTPQELAQQLGCHRTTISRFYENSCLPWIREYFAEELEDLL